MIAIGFIEKIDNKIIKKKYLESENISPSKYSVLDKAEKKQVIKYLNEGDRIFSITLGVFDADNYIGPYVILSDGEWIWPSHFTYYLANQDYINSDLLSHIKKKKYLISPLTNAQKKEAIFFLENEMLNLSHRKE